jgi:S-adenosylmethionine:tRNA ribosyltransferase-isomerase
VLVSEFDFTLPDELIAQQPAARGESRLLVMDRDRDELEHRSITDLGTYLRAGDVLVVTDTRVFAARLLGRRPSGGQVECLLVARVDRGEEQRTEIWDALMHPGQKLKPGAVVHFEGDAGALKGTVLERAFFGRRRIRLEVERGSDVATVVDAIGHIPLPPYIKRPDEPDDRERYQTVFARARGSIAAPTAGLHFTPAILDRLAESGVTIAAVTLHVGYGTFKPVRSERVDDHVVDPERYEISAETADLVNRAPQQGRRVVVVGTTTTRALEDAAQRGDGVVPAGAADATLFIRPGFRFRVVDALLTNFHLPSSSLLMLVAAFAGRERVLAAYREAVSARYRFYSYGDAMLIL